MWGIAPILVTEGYATANSVAFQVKPRFLIFFAKSINIRLTADDWWANWLFRALTASFEEHTGKDGWMTKTVDA